MPCYCVNEPVFQNNTSGSTGFQQRLLNNILIRRTLAFILDMLLIIAILKILGLIYSLILAYHIIYLGEWEQLIPQRNIGNIIVFWATVAFSLREFLFGAKGHRQSLGKRLFGLEVIKNKSGRSPVWSHIVRNLPNFLICFPGFLFLLYFIVEYMFMYFRGWRLIDYITDTRVQEVSTGIFYYLHRKAKHE